MASFLGARDDEPWAMIIQPSRGSHSAAPVVAYSPWLASKCNYEIQILSCVVDREVSNKEVSFTRWVWPELSN